MKNTMLAVTWKGNKNIQHGKSKVSSIITCGQAMLYLVIYKKDFNFILTSFYTRLNGTYSEPKN
jgi:hypothetical protein